MKKNEIPLRKVEIYSERKEREKRKTKKKKGARRIA